MAQVALCGTVREGEVRRAGAPLPVDAAPVRMDDASEVLRDLAWCAGIIGRAYGVDARVLTSATAGTPPSFSTRHHGNHTHRQRDLDDRGLASNA
jgi:hypothetical protein